MQGFIKEIGCIVQKLYIDPGNYFYYPLYTCFVWYMQEKWAVFKQGFAIYFICNITATITAINNN